VVPEIETFGLEQLRRRFVRLLAPDCVLAPALQAGHHAIRMVSDWLSDPDKPDSVEDGVQPRNALDIFNGTPVGQDS
jgi:hypothetical protein